MVAWWASPPGRRDRLAADALRARRHGDRGPAADAPAATDDRRGGGARGRCGRRGFALFLGDPGLRRDRRPIGDRSLVTCEEAYQEAAEEPRPGGPRPVAAGLGPGGGALLAGTRPADAVRGRRSGAGGAAVAVLVLYVLANLPSTIAPDRGRRGRGRRGLGSARVVVRRAARRRSRAMSFGPD